ncbi:MAG: 2-succinyl-5-enolpyruvyl-6-hydroxy-3-cyclohexene-1-carboxylic-acid synthase [Micrococcales bacterium]|nr:2-succinyl-5-enolpyruvyl-6-hydroxy-3-cyclohexene-1-carboxylic-acid synthase [Micrococcales bacterium]
MNPSTASARVLVDELVRCGVREAVLAPGSRSAPLAYALQTAERAGLLRLHVRVDERSAGFLALGLAKLSRRPAVVVTTSGTAVANLHPAVLEAHHAMVPLIVLSADRPAELRGTGANQTTVQPGLFGDAVRWSADLPAAESRAGQQAGWRTSVDRAYAAATGSLSGHPGPVHLNVGFRDPLIPDADAGVGIGVDGRADADGRADGAHADAGSRGDGSWLGGEWPEPLAGRADGAPWTSVPAAAAPGAGGGPLAPGFPRTLMVLGDLPDPTAAKAAVDWARAHGWPVVAEPFGHYDRSAVLPHGPLLLTATEWLDAHAPDRVITIGRVTLARPVANLLRRSGIRVEAVTAGAHWVDPGHRAEVVHPWSVVGAPMPGPGSGGGVGDRAWASAWREAGETVAATLADEPAAWASGPAIVGALLSALADDDVLVVGASNPVRDLDVALAARPRGLTVVAYRGLAGIDGTVSSAIGIALAGDRRTVAYMGDLTFLHDSGGLLIGPDEPRPDLTLVVANDDGGGIFTLLEHGEPSRATDFERIFGTATGTDIAALCAAHGVHHELAASAEELTAALARPHAGIRVVEVPQDRACHRGAHQRLREQAADALARHT